MNRVKFLVFILMLSPILASADRFDDIVSSLKLGNASNVSKFFNTNVELTLLENEDLYWHS